nr:MAG TPA: hypothetical protein [Caudoviricetes sp.]
MTCSTWCLTRKTWTRRLRRGRPRRRPPCGELRRAWTVKLPATWGRGGVITGAAWGSSARPSPIPLSIGS